MQAIKIGKESGAIYDVAEDKTKFNTERWGIRFKGSNLYHWFSELSGLVCYDNSYSQNTGATYKDRDTKYRAITKLVNMLPSNNMEGGQNGN